MCFVLIEWRLDSKMKKLLIALFAIFVLVSAQAFAQCVVTIDTIEGSWDDAGTVKLTPGALTTFKFRCDVACDLGNFGFNIANAFVVSSPDGADWGYAQSKTYADWTSFSWAFAFLNHFNKTGGTGSWGAVQTIGAGNVGGNDSIAVLLSGAAIAATGGMRGGYDGVPYGIEIQPTAGSAGKHICIDTTYCPAGMWKWPCITISHASIVPNWYASPQCYLVEDEMAVDPDPTGLLPTKFNLVQNYPNPFNPATTIQFDLPRASDVTIEVFNVLGQRVATPVDGEMPAGFHKVSWNSGNQASGVYFYRLTANGNVIDTKKMMLLK
jgi:hypothetical protein